MVLAAKSMQVGGCFVQVLTHKRQRCRKRRSYRRSLPLSCTIASGQYSDSSGVAAWAPLSRVPGHAMHSTSGPQQHGAPRKHHAHHVACRRFRSGRGR